MDLTATLGLDAARALDPAPYAIGGTAPRIAVRPTTREEVAEVLRAATAERLGVVPWGGGVALAREQAPERFDVALDVRGLDRVVEYEPEDLTLTAECGISFETLRAAVAARGQELPLEAAEAWGATLGGVLAANASGPRRLQLGAPHDRILGARYALGDGTLARSGGKVVKNVAGYGIHRLLCGSRGALGVILEASLKLAPAPESRAAMVYAVEAEALADAARWARFPRLEPAALTVIGRAISERSPVFAHRTAFTVVVGFEGDAAHVERLCAITREALGVPTLKLADASALTLWQNLADLEELPGPRLTLASPHKTPHALAALAATSPLARAVFHAPSGRLLLFPESAASDAAAAAPTLAPLLRDLHAHGFTLAATRGLAALEPVVAPQAAVAAMRASLRSALDPSGTLALGPRWG